MMRAAIPLLVLSQLACARPLIVEGPIPPMTQRDGQGLAMSQDVVDRIAQLMRRGIRDQIEPAACVSSYRIGTDNGHPIVDIYALTLADVDSANEFNVWYHGPHLCGDSMPSLHGHVSRSGDIPWPSPMDSATIQRFSAPFGLLVYRAGNDSTVGVIVYWKRP